MTSISFQLLTRSGSRETLPEMRMNLSLLRAPGTVRGRTSGQLRTPGPDVAAETALSDNDNPVT